ncbi:oligosaccharide flippase family protein [Massilia sp. GCM10023247]|uniref:oligosaccharide flippase family protein n=1 Tax=Massilia sp. GCM10023247 TaxID=3252643 RepID=UPI00361EC3A9
MPSPSSIKRNIAVNYASQIYVTLVGIAMVPVYLQYMGAEAYGLVGFFVMLQAWFQLLDFGLTPTMAREIARFRGGAGSAASLRELLRALEAVFFGIALLGGIALVFGSGTIANSWLKVDRLPLAEVAHAVSLMGIAAALRLVSGLYRGAVSGFECMSWLGGVNAFFATARFVVVIPVFIFIGNGPAEFFWYQLCVALAELAIVAWKSYSLLPAMAPDERTRLHFSPLRNVLKFSLGIAFSGLVWIAVTQVDKLLLSKMLALEEYAYFTLSVLVAGGVLVISGPISTALLPRLTVLATQAREVEFFGMYRKATNLLCVLAIPVSLVITLFAEQVLWIWTGDTWLAARAAPVLQLYAVGNCILAIGAFPYYLQIAKGDLKLHLVGNILFLVVLIPALIAATLHFGARGAGWAWAGANLVYFLLWVPRIHRRFSKGLHHVWLLRDVGGILLPAAAAGALLHQLIQWPMQRGPAAIVLAAASLATLAAAAAGSPSARALSGALWLRLAGTQKVANRK